MRDYVLAQFLLVLNQHSTASKAETLVIIHFRSSYIKRHRIEWYILLVGDEPVDFWSPRISVSL